MHPLLFFHQDLSDSKTLIEGRLELIDKDTDTILDRFIATSGLPGYQSNQHLSSRGRGSIPPQYDVQIPCYKVAAVPLYMPNIEGVKGNFYKIEPHLVDIRGVKRGDFGIHFDANVPGSAGCIVCRTLVGWKAFESHMKNLRQRGFSSVKLLVGYCR